MKDFPIEEQPIPFHDCAIAASDLALAGTAIAGGALGFIIGVLAGDAGMVGHGVKVGTAIGTVIINPILVTVYWNYTIEDKRQIMLILSSQVYTCLVDSIYNATDLYICIILEPMHYMHSSPTVSRWKV